MRKNLHHKIMLSILAGSLALGFVYAPPAFAEDVLIADTSYTSPDGTRGTYDLDADGTNPGTNYNNTSITLPTGPIDKFTVTAGDGGNIEISAAGGNLTGGNGGNVTLTFNETVTDNITATGGNGGNIENSAYGGNLTGGNGGIVTLTFDKTVTGNITATGGNGSNIEILAYGGNLTGGNGGNVTLTFNETVTGNINATGSDGGSIEISAYGGNLTGGNGGNATLTFNDIVVTDNISLTSGTNGTRNGANSTPGNGGSVNFTANSISGTQSTDSSGNTTTGDIDIELTKNDGDITFDVGTLNIADNTVTIKTKNSPNSDVNDNNIVICKTGDNHIDTLYLTGNGIILMLVIIFKLAALPLTTVRLTIITGKITIT